MAAPFSGEDLIKRSILSSILGLKIKAPRFNYQPEACASSSRTPYPRPVNYDQPCSSKTILNQSEVVVEQEGGCVYPDSQHHQTNHYINYEEFQGGDQTLSEQLAEGLFWLHRKLSSHPNLRLILDLLLKIFTRRLCVSVNTLNSKLNQRQYLRMHTSIAVFEHDHLAVLPVVASQELQQRSTDYSNSSSTLLNLVNEIPLPRPTQNICVQCHHAIAPKMLYRIESAATQDQLAEQQEDAQKIVEPQLVAFEHLKEASIGPVSLEEFVKMVVLAVKEAGGLSKSTKERIETPEEILQRKRLQNNEAAARYRRRQKEARLAGENEITGLIDRNKELREEIQEMQKQIDIIKSKFAVNLPPKHY
uniref:BZIP domain-containing protein n=1 Tax=Ditylenchus dipsaci TaxID=166011 RepID=A0A915DXC1_9BILA